MLNNIKPDNTCFIIPTYNPPINLEDNIKSLIKYNQQIYIFDNNSIDKDNLKKLKNIEIFFSNTNYGYAYAINYFIKNKINDFEWFCMLDQDSKLNLDYFDYLNKYFDFKKKNTGLIGTNVKYKDFDKNLLNFKTNKKILEKKKHLYAQEHL